MKDQSRKAKVRTYTAVQLQAILQKAIELVLEQESDPPANVTELRPSTPAASTDRSRPWCQKHQVEFILGPFGFYCRSCYREKKQQTFDDSGK